MNFKIYCKFCIKIYLKYFNMIILIYWVYVSVNIELNNRNNCKGCINMFLVKI